MTIPKTVLITGCASGIGRHLAGALSDCGHRVVATDVNEAGLEEAAELEDWYVAGIETELLDVTDPADWRRVADAMCEDHGWIDVMINAAGYLKPGWVFETDIEAIDLQVDVNLKGTMYGTRIVGKRMVERGRGHIINFASLAGLAPVSGIGVYSGTKFGVRGFSLAAAQDLQRRGVALTAVLPDAVDTPMLREEADYEEAAVTFSGNRALTVEDIEEVIIEDVLERQPMEVTVPPSRGAIARLAGLTPSILPYMDAIFRRIGEENREKYQ